MYQALYRKYRPSTFNDVIGQDPIVRTLKNAIANDKLTHAYLFAGPRGTGKTSTAKILAKTINCQNLNGFEPCNHCDCCIQINNKQTTDIIEIDAASNNGVDEIRELKSKVNLVPSNSKYKVYIIDEVHMLSTGAFNALLKTLEEPPSHIIFILATTEPHKIPATILSRCQRFDFKKISENKIVENLKKIVQKENIEIEEDALHEIAILAQGGMRDSISLLDQAISYCSEKITCDAIHEINGTIGNSEMKEIVQIILNKNIVDLLKIFDDLDDRGKNLIKLVEELIYYLRNVLVYQITPNYFDKYDETVYFDLGIEIKQDVLLKYIRIFSEAIHEMKNSDNEKITLELYLIELINADKVEEKSEIILPVSELKMDEPIKKETKNISVKNTQSEKSEILVNTNNSQKVQDNQEEKMIKVIKEIRINNTLSCFNKKMMLEMKEQLELIKKYLFDEIYGQWASLILDGELKAAGRDHLIFVYKDAPMENLFNHNWSVIEEIFEEAYSQKFLVVAVSLEEWNIIRQEFNSKSKTYTWKEEPKSVSEKKSDHSKNELETLFGDIIEYSE